VLITLAVLLHKYFKVNKVIQNILQITKMNKLIIASFLIVVVLAVFIRTTSHQFVNLDDYDYVTQNHHVTGGITQENIAWAFTTFHAANWHPITWISHMIDCQLYDLNPWGHHLTNVLLHVANTILLFLLLSRLTGTLWRSALVATLFAIHPLHVESVAWVSERKDVLSTMFLLVTLICYVNYAQHRKLKYYCLAIVAFSFGLMTKPMLVTALRRFKWVEHIAC
jgi:protein O-mannosyl-transferase